MRAYRSPVPAAPARPRLAPARTGRRSAEPDAPPPARTSAAVLLREIVAHLRQCRVQLRDEWVRRIIEARTLTAMSQEEIFAEATSIYDNYLDALETGTLEAVQAYAGQLSERIVPRGVETRKVVGIDITGVPAMDADVANHLVRTVDASRLQGAKVIVTGLSPEIAQTLVTIGVDLGKMNTVGDLQGGIEEAERLLGYQVVPVPEAKR